MFAMRKQTDNPADKPTARVFFALWPTATESRQLVGWQTPLHHLCGGRTMRRETLHSTLVFLGEIESSRLEALQLAAQEVSGKSFELCFDTARYWGHNHIVYATASHLPQPLLQLADALAQQLKRHRFKFDQRDYTLHTTLSRNARWTDAPLPTMQPVRWQVKDFVLVQSVARDEGVDYRVLVRFPLGIA